MIYFLLPLVLLGESLFPNNRKNPDYDLHHPVKVVELPAELKEISALTDVTDDLIACVQDERGIIYTYSISANCIITRDSILPNGDFEGLTYHDSTFYLLRSEGMLFIYDLRKKSIDSITTGIAAFDNEGLGWNPHQSALMIASKSAPSRVAEQKDQREIHLFHPGNRPITIRTYFTIDVAAIRKMAQEKKLSSGKYTKDGRPKEIQFRPSSLAFLPGTKQLYVLSASDPLLAIYSDKGVLLDLKVISPEILSKPEGITFLSNKTMIISTEGKTSQPKLAFYTFSGR